MQRLLRTLQHPKNAKAITHIAAQVTERIVLNKGKNWHGTVATMPMKPVFGWFTSTSTQFWRTRVRVFLRIPDEGSWMAPSHRFVGFELKERKVFAVVILRSHNPRIDDQLVSLSKVTWQLFGQKVGRWFFTTCCSTPLSFDNPSSRRVTQPWNAFREHS